MKKNLILLISMLLITSSQAAVYDDAIGYWQFEGSDPQLVEDSTTNGNDLYLGNSDQIDAEEALRESEGLFGSGIWCPRAEGMVSSVYDVNALDFGPDDPFTIALWVINEHRTSNTTLVSKQMPSDPYRGYSFIWQSGDSLQFLHRSDNSAQKYLWVDLDVPINEIVPAGKWVHVAMTYDGSLVKEGVKFYLNGIEMDQSLLSDHVVDATFSVSDDTTNDTPFAIGGRGDYSVFGGYMDEVAVWGRALSANEISEAMIQTLPASITQANVPLYVMEQNQTTDTFNIALTSQPSAEVDVTVDPNNANIDIGAGADNPVVLTFTSANWDQPKTVTVEAVDDTTEEGPHYSSIDFAFSSSDSNFDSRAMHSVLVYVEDNDVPGVKLVDEDNVQVDEAGPISDTYSVVLLSQPAADVTISATDSADEEQVNITPASLTFTTSNWDQPQDFTVEVIDSDMLTDVQLETIIDHSVTSTDADYEGQSVDSVTVDIVRKCVGPYLLADLNEDCFVNFEDLALLADSWLECTESGNPDCN